MARLLLLMTSTTYKATAFLGAAARLGVDVVVGSDTRQALEQVNPAGHLALPFHDPEAAVGRIRSRAAVAPLHAIVACDDEGAVLAAQAAQALGLPHNPPEAVRVAQNKRLTRDRMSRAGLDVPRYWNLSTDEDPARAAASVSYPVVLKPLDLSASRGVIRADDAPAFVAAMARLRQIVSPQPGVAVPLLAESFIPGKEVTLEGLLERGRLRQLAVFDKPDPLDGPFFQETILVTPSRHPAPVLDKVRQATERVVEAIGLHHGPIHAELRVDWTGGGTASTARGAARLPPTASSARNPGAADAVRVTLLEVAPRSIGGRCGQALRFGDGTVTLEELILRQALGHDARLARETHAAGVMMLPIPKAGILNGVHGVAAARQLPHIESVEITIPPGQWVEPPPEGRRYLGFLFARAASAAEVEQALRRAHAALDIQIDAGSAGMTDGASVTAKAGK